MVTTLISPCGILGYGFPAASLEKALEQSPDAIVVDAGSTNEARISWARVRPSSAEWRRRRTFPC